MRGVFSVAINGTAARAPRPGLKAVQRRVKALDMNMRINVYAYGGLLKHRKGVSKAT